MLIEFFVPGAPPGPNQREPTTRGRMVSTKTQREKAYVAALAVRNKRRIPPITGPARITMEIHRCRLLDPSVNAVASLKAYQDGICKALLPLGDGPRTPYTWLPPTQKQVPRGRDGVWVVIEVEEPVAVATEETYTL
jgi:hypothetical protein